MYRPDLVAFHCRKCERWLADAVPNAQAHCPRCLIWNLYIGCSGRPEERGR